VIEPDSAGWEVRADGFQRFLQPGEGLREWDAALRFRLERNFRVVEDFRPLLGLSCDGRVFEVAVFVTTARGQSRTIATRLPLPSAVAGALLVSFEPDSRMIAHELEIEVSVQLATDIEAADPVSPRRSASRLWSHSDRIRLEGGSSRLAMYEADLGKMRPGVGLERARLLVDRRGEADEPFEHAVAVWLNSRRRDFTEALNSGQPGTSEEAWSAVVRQLCMMALNGDWWDSDAVYEAGSLGETVGRWLRQMGNGVWSVGDLRTRLISNPASFDSMINSFVAGLGGIDQ
jgi:hypothetical protein